MIKSPPLYPPIPLLVWMLTCSRLLRSGFLFILDKVAVSGYHHINWLVGNLEVFHDKSI